MLLEGAVESVAPFLGLVRRVSIVGLSQRAGVSSYRTSHNSEVSDSDISY